MNTKQTRSPFILYLLVTLSPLGIDLHLPALVQLKTQFSINDSMAQLSILVFVIAMGVGQLICGFMANQIGKRRIGFWGIIFFMLGALGVFFSENYALLLFCRALQGLGASGASVIAYAAVNENYNDKKAAEIFSIQSGCLNLIPAIAPLLGASLLLFAHWKIIFLVFIVYGCGVFYYFQKTFHYTDSVSTDSHQLALKGIRQDGSFSVYSLVCIILLGYIMTFLNLAPLLMVEKLGVTTLFFTICFGFNALVIATTSFSLKYFIQKYGTEHCITVGLFIMLLSSIGLWLFANNITPLIFMSLIALGSIGFAFSFGTSISLALAKHKAYSGIASGFLGFLYLSVSPIIAYLTLKNGSHSSLPFGLTFTVLVTLMLIVVKVHQHTINRESL